MLDTYPSTSRTMEKKAELAHFKMRRALEDIYRADNFNSTGSAHKVKIPFTMLTQGGEIRHVEITINVSEKPAKAASLPRLGGRKRTLMVGGGSDEDEEG